MYAQAGFEVGGILGVRGRLGNAERALGLRIGVRTALRRDIALQPIGLVFFEAPIGTPRLVASVGATRVDGEYLPVAGLAVGTKGKLFRGHAGVLVATDQFSPTPDGTPLSWTPDVGLSWTW